VKPDTSPATQTSPTCRSIINRTELTRNETGQAAVGEGEEKEGLEDMDSKGNNRFAKSE
jgi:hypothetical protein